MAVWIVILIFDARRCPGEGGHLGAFETMPRKITTNTVLGDLRLDMLAPLKPDHFRSLNYPYKIRVTLLRLGEGGLQQEVHEVARVCQLIC